MFLNDLDYFKTLDVELINFVIEMSTNCPNKCKYCFYSYSQEQEYVLKMSDYDDFLSFIYELSKYKLVTLNIQYDGNEGHLRNLINKFFEFKLFHVSISIQSSGLGINTQLLSLLKFLGIKISFSFDGFFEGARKNKIALNAMNLAAKSGINFGIITVVYNEIESRLFNDFKELVKIYDHFFRGIYYNLIYTKEYSMFPKAQILVKQYEKIYNYILKNELKINFHPLETIFKRFFSPYAKLCDDGGCAAYNRIFALSANGRLYGCDSFVRNCEFENNDFLESKQKVLLEVDNIKNELGCNNCEYVKICDKICLGKFLSINKNLKSLHYICDYNRLCNILAIKLYRKNQSLVQLFLSTNNYQISPKTYYWDSTILEIGKELKNLKLDVNAIGSKFLANSFFLKDKDKLNYEYENLFQVLHNISETFIVKWFGLDANIKKIISDKYIYYLVPKGLYFDNKNKYFELLKEDNYEKYFQIKVEASYFLDKINLLLKYPQKNELYYKELIKIFTNLYARVMLLLLFEPIYDGISEYDYSIEMAKLKYNILYNYDIDEFKTKSYYIHDIYNMNTKLKSIISARKKELKKDINKYYLYDIIDTALYFADAIHGVINKLVQVFNIISCPDKEKFFDVEYEELKLNPTILSDLIYYNMIAYRNNIFDKAVYIDKIKQFLHLKEITKDTIIKYYPLISPEILNYKND